VAALWLATTVTATFMAWVGVRSVVAAAVPPRTQPLSAAEIRSATPAPNLGPTTPFGSLKPRPTPAPALSTPPAPSLPTDQWYPLADGHGGTAYLRSFHMAGGDAALRFAADSVTVISATPNQGYAVEVRPKATNELVVNFRSDSHLSQIDAYWENGPRTHLSEARL